MLLSQGKNLAKHGLVWVDPIPSALSLTPALDSLLIQSALAVPYLSAALKT